MNPVVSRSFITRAFAISTLFLMAQPVSAGSYSLEFCGNNGIRTAIGCIGTDPASLVATLTAVGIGLGGGVAFLMIILGGMQMQLSAGNPERMQQAKETVESAITGLLLIVFSVFILRVIGVNILNIPGFD